LTPRDRALVLDELSMLRVKYPKLEVPSGVLNGFAKPPASPAECIFARTTTCVSADFRQPITPCQFGGTPDCSECGCMASAGLAAVGRFKLLGAVEVGDVFDASLRIGGRVRRMRQAMAGPRALEVAPQED
jgi:hypothetical protein